MKSITLVICSCAYELGAPGQQVEYKKDEKVRVRFILLPIILKVGITGGYLETQQS